MGNTSTILRVGGKNGSLRGGTLSGSGVILPTIAPSAQSRKKLYERMLMQRKVKAYLDKMPTIDQEMDLDRLSLDCEPPANAINAGNSSMPPSRRRMPSPSPSSLSSHSSQSAAVASLIEQQKQQRMHLPKFGNIL